jgi:hypothetical protein
MNEPLPIQTNRHDRRTNLKRAKINLNEMAKLKAKVKNAPPEREGPKELPREMVSALRSGDEQRVTACVDLALKDGWDYGDLIRSFEAHRLNMLLENATNKIENAKKGNSILIV